MFRYPPKRNRGDHEDGDEGGGGGGPSKYSNHHGGRGDRLVVPHQKRSRQGDGGSDDDDEGDDEARMMNMDPLEKEVTNAVTSALALDLQNFKNTEKEARLDRRAAAGLEGDGDCDQEGDRVPASSSKSSSVVNTMVCGNCTEKAKYTCPACNFRSCSLVCVKAHKADTGCTGERNPAEKILLSEFTDRDLTRDLHFIEDGKRLQSNCRRTFQKEHSHQASFRFSFRTLPPPLHNFREGAKKHGVLCQILSEGLSKRERNTSRYDKRTDTITWRTEFRFYSQPEPPAAVAALEDGDECDLGNNFVGPFDRRAVISFVAATDWSSERFKMADILTNVSEVNPKVESFHIRKGHSRQHEWMEGVKPTPQTKLLSSPQGDGWATTDPSSSSDAPATTTGNKSSTRSGAHEEEEMVEEDGGPRGGLFDLLAPEPIKQGGDNSGENDDVPLNAESGGKHHIAAARSSSAHHPPGTDPSMVVLDVVEGDLVPSNKTIQPEHRRTALSASGKLDTPELLKAAVDEYLQGDDCDVTLFVKAERLSSEVAYFAYTASEIKNLTLHDVMRDLFFVVEFPIFEVVHNTVLSSCPEVAAQFPVITKAHRSAIRESFRSKVEGSDGDGESVAIGNLLNAGGRGGDRGGRGTGGFSRGGRGGRGGGYDAQSSLSDQRINLEPGSQKLPCRNFTKGSCVHGDQCPYQHMSLEELPPCRGLVNTGVCDRGDRCSFSHDPEKVAAKTAEIASHHRGRGGRGGGGFGGGHRGGFSFEHRGPPQPPTTGGGQYQQYPSRQY